MPAAVRNVAREKLEQRQLSLGVGVPYHAQRRDRQTMTVAGFDWLFFRHGARRAPHRLTNLSPLLIRR